MYIVIENDKFLGFSLKKETGYENFEITEKEHSNFIEKQGQGFTLFWSNNRKKLETILLGQFEELVDGIVVYKKEKEVEYNNNQLTYLRKRYTELKVAKADSEELGMDTADIDTEIATLKVKVVSTQAKIKQLKSRLK